MNTSERKFCPCCGTEMILKPLFTSMYHECPRCEPEQKREEPAKPQVNPHMDDEDGWDIYQPIIPPDWNCKREYLRTTTGRWRGGIIQPQVFPKSIINISESTLKEIQSRYLSNFPVWDSYVKEMESFRERIYGQFRIHDEIIGEYAASDAKAIQSYVETISNRSTVIDDTINKIHAAIAKRAKKD